MHISPCMGGMVPKVPLGCFATITGSYPPVLLDGVQGLQPEVLAVLAVVLPSGSTYE